MATAKEKLTAVADKVREISGSEELLSLDAMTTHLSDANSEVSSQGALIQSIKVALEGKALEGGGTGEISLQAKTVTPSKSVQEVGPDTGYDGLSKVTVSAIPSEYIVPSGEVEITENGVHNVSNYASVNVNVEGEGGGSADPELPEGYSRCDYIQFTGEQTVDIGVICNQNTKIQVGFTREKTAQHYLYGVASSDNTSAVTAYLGGSWRFGNKSVTKTVTTDADMIYNAVVNNSKIMITGSSSAISSVNEFETVGTLQLGGCRNSSGTNGAPQFEGKILFFIMWQGDEQILKLVPVTDGNGVYRFYDTVSKTFFDSITDTPLSGGNL